MMTFYHGTTDAFNIKRVLLPPTYTNNLREEWRKKYHNMVFFTTSLLSASKFARKASGWKTGESLGFTKKDAFAAKEYEKYFDIYVNDKIVAKFYKDRQFC